MAQFSADIALKLNSTAAERGIRKVERNLNKIESTTKDILGVDKQIIRERRALVRISGEQATKSKRRIKDLSLQKAELSLQKRELQQINRLEKQRAANIRRASGASASGGGGVGGVGAFAGGLVAAKALSPKQLITKSKALKGLEEFRDRQNDALDAVVEDLDEATKKYQQKLDRFNEVRAKRPLLTSKGTFQPTTRTSRNSFFSAREGLFDARGQVGSQTKLVKGLDNQIGDLTKELDASAKASRRAQGAFSGLGKALAAVGIAIGTVEIARFIGNSFKTTAAIESQRIRLKALSTGFDDYQLVLQAVDRAQGLFNQTQQEAAEGFGTAYSRLRPLGLTLEQIQAVYEGFNTAAFNSGTTAAEAAGPFTQLTQALGAGALRGDELRSILEQTPAIAQAIAKELKITVGQLKDFGKEGKISSEAVLKALVAVRNEGVNKLSEALDTPVQKFKKLEIAGENFKIAIADEVLPAVTEAVEQLGEIITALAGPIRFISKLANKTLGGVLDLINAATKPGDIAAAASIRGGRLPFNIQGSADLFAGTGPQGKGLKGLQDQAAELAKLRNQPVKDVLLELMQDRLEAIEAVKAAAIEPITISTDLSGVLGDKPTGGEDPKIDTSAADRVAAAEARLRDATSEVDLTRELLTLQQDLAAAELAGNEKLQIRIKGIQQEVEIRARAVDAIRNETDERVQQAIDAKALLDVESARLETGKQLALLAKEQSAEAREQVKAGIDAARAADEALNAELTSTEELLNSIGGKITNGLVDGLALAVTETDKLGEAFRDLAKDILEAIGKQLILTAITQGISALGGNDGKGLFSLLGGALGKREDGGPVLPNRPYIVGEAGPELMVPSSSGTVVDADSTAKAMSRWNAGNSSSVGPQDGGGDVYGNGAAGAAQSINVTTGPVMQFQGENYVNQKDFRAGLAQAAQQGARQGEALTLKRLKNSQSTRRKVGI